MQQVKLVVLGGGNTRAAHLLIYNFKVLLGTICTRLNNTLQSKGTEYYAKSFWIGFHEELITYFKHLYGEKNSVQKA